MDDVVVVRYSMPVSHYEKSTKNKSKMNTITFPFPTNVQINKTKTQNSIKTKPPTNSRKNMSPQLLPHHLPLQLLHKPRSRHMPHQHMTLHLHPSLQRPINHRIHMGKVIPSQSCRWCAVFVDWSWLGLTEGCPFEMVFDYDGVEFVGYCFGVAGGCCWR